MSMALVHGITAARPGLSETMHVYQNYFYFRPYTSQFKSFKNNRSSISISVLLGQKDCGMFGRVADRMAPIVTANIFGVLYHYCERLDQTV